MNAPRTTAALLTPPGRGAVASVSVAGPSATALVAQLFRPTGHVPLNELPLGRIALGRWAADDGEELVVCRHAETELEIHCHGGAAAVASILQSLSDAGCAVITWQERNAGETTDPIKAAARIALSQASTERGALILLDQHAGALTREIVEIVASLRASNTIDVAARLGVLIERARVGLHLTTPWQVVLAGPPNAGKSSLINALAGYQRSIVFDQPGTTRDVVTVRTALDGWPVELSDTAGLRSASDALEQAGIERAAARLATADAVVLVLDRSAFWTGEQAALVAAWPHAICVHNKSDLPPTDINVRPLGLEISAVTGQGLPQLIERILATLIPSVPAVGEAVPFTLRQRDGLMEALSHVQACRLAEAIASLQGLS